MKKVLMLFTALVLLVASTTTVFAANGKAIYSDNAGEFIFQPGSEYSPTDLFANYKGVMPGDSVEQTIQVRNDADKKVKVKIYMRALGAHEDSDEFLSHLNLRVQKRAEEEMAYMFDAPANQSAQLTDWVCLGTLYSGGTVTLDVLLDVPVELGNEYQNAIGYLDWEFMVEEYPIEPDDPKPPHTGDDNRLTLWIGLMAVSLVMMVVLLLMWKKNHREEDDSKTK